MVLSISMLSSLLSLWMFVGVVVDVMICGGCDVCGIDGIYLFHYTHMKIIVGNNDHI